MSRRAARPIRADAAGPHAPLFALESIIILIYNGEIIHFLSILRSPPAARERASQVNASPRQPSG